MQSNDGERFFTPSGDQLTHMISWTSWLSRLWTSSVSTSSWRICGCNKKKDGGGGRGGIMVLLSGLELISLAGISHRQQLSLFIYIMTLNRSQSGTEDSRTLVSGFPSFWSSVMWSVFFTNFTSRSAILLLGQLSTGFTDGCYVLLCLTSLIKSWFPKLPLCTFLLSSLCPKTRCLSQCQELPFGFVYGVLTANWTNKLTD